MTTKASNGDIWRTPTKRLWEILYDRWKLNYTVFTQNSSHKWKSAEQYFEFSQVKDSLGKAYIYLVFLSWNCLLWLISLHIRSMWETICDAQAS